MLPVGRGGPVIRQSVLLEYLGKNSSGFTYRKDRL